MIQSTVLAISTAPSTPSRFRIKSSTYPKGCAFSVATRAHSTSAAVLIARAILLHRLAQSHLPRKRIFGIGILPGTVSMSRTPALLSGTAQSPTGSHDMAKDRIGYGIRLNNGRRIKFPPRCQPFIFSPDIGTRPMSYLPRCVRKEQATWRPYCRYYRTPVPAGDMRWDTARERRENICRGSAHL